MKLNWNLNLSSYLDDGNVSLSDTTVQYVGATSMKLCIYIYYVCRYLGYNI